MGGRKHERVRSRIVGQSLVEADAGDPLTSQPTAEPFPAWEECSAMNPQRQVFVQFEGRTRVVEVDRESIEELMSGLGKRWTTGNG